MTHSIEIKDNTIYIPDHLIYKGEVKQNFGFVIKGELFKDIDTVENLLSKYPEYQKVKIKNKLVSPGFIDTHNHLAQSFGKSLVFGEPSEIFKRIWIPMESNLTERSIKLSAKLGCLESLRGGFTTVVDPGARTEKSLSLLAESIEEVGIRAVLAKTSNDKIGANEFRPMTDIVKESERFISQYQSHDLITPSLAIAIPEIASDKALEFTANLCKESKCLFQTHANEHLVAVERSLIDRSLRPIEHLSKANALNEYTLLAHSTLLTPPELKLIKNADANVSYCPVASAWKGNAVLPAELLYHLDVNVGLGTDSTRSDGFRLMDTAEMAHRFTYGIKNGDFNCGSGDIWLSMATDLAAKSIKSNDIGSIEIGKKADFLIIDIYIPELSPSWDLIWEMVRLMNKSQIDQVIVNGKTRLYKGMPVDWDLNALLDEVNLISKDIVLKSPIHKINEHFTLN
ncbi:amidohydrolase family protein [Vibrio sp. SS-MA-C1-2]|uniref:amidohydrolase family protein n=1 Tax=Vibrio sp. SS-MA-C1-2 TaxID=2908646 RepID=UPI001F48A78A|nr:amidohydrolase family protein [Vibrio sp. SS-MA-C1-2]UJF16951.1 amidohydrolase family protein [Vibrio sp. SS-MA-C1-2]